MEVEQAFRMLLENKVQSAPVWDQTESRFVGFLELRDLVSYALVESDDAGKHGKPSGGLLGSLVHVLRVENSVYPSDDGEMKEQTHHHVSYLARRNPFKPFKLEQSIAEAITLLGSKGCHRLPVMNSDGKLVNILSQSSVIDFLNRHMDQLGDLADKTVAELKLGSYPCVSVKGTDSAYCALQVIVIVSEEDGTLVANTSGSDLLIFLRDGVSLAMPVLDFFAQAQQANMGADRAPSVTCHESDPLRKVVAKLAKTKQHRLFVCDAKKQPLGIISVADICNLFAKLLALPLPSEASSPPPAADSSPDSDSVGDSDV
eukprot:CAMPEP_0198232150 /NCGR_PEP_ID=MMETSP1445-20131203/115576_1 /TAXON_ID=36898 /ORGANISM="Pyramimonas sp., Strain CCMP2087" /LENGTH=315 /DNA_ID=CAMNT_0043912801 /DNA_START=176 /DNA_END=1123 /DNA_ORIENTATION=-